MRKIKGDQEDEDEDIDELADDASTTSEGVQEKMVLDVPSRLPTPTPASKTTAVSGDAESPVGASDPELAAHKPGHSLYPLLHIEGDPALKLPALDFKGDSKSPLSRPSLPPSPCRLYVRPPLRRAARRPALARSMPT